MEVSLQNAADLLSDKLAKVFPHLSFVVQKNDEHVNINDGLYSDECYKKTQPSIRSKLLLGMK